MADWHSIDWQAEEAALARYFQGRNLTLAQITALLELCLAEAVGALAGDPVEADRVMGELAERMRLVAAESCRPGAPAH